MKVPKTKRKDTSVAIRLEADLVAKIDRLAKKSKVTRSEAIRWLIVEAIDTALEL